MLEILLVGGTYEPHQLDQIVAQYGSKVDVPACVLEWKIAEGLSEQQGVALYLVNERRMPTFPACHVVVSPSVVWECNLASGARHFGFINLPGLKHLSKVLGVLGALRALHRQDERAERVILVYALHTPYLLASTAYAVCTHIPQYLIVPDLPSHMYGRSPSVLRRGLKWLDDRVQRQLLKRVDGFFLLSEHMAEPYGISADRFTVLEGVADRALPDSRSTFRPVSPQAIMYSGALSARYGIAKLIAAFERCEACAELWICGDGEARDLVEQASQANERIKYFGQVPRQQVMDLQRRAALLVNPRDSRDDYTVYSFPSKTLEYMQSGTPLLMSALKGIPAEYAKYYWRVDDDSAEAWTAKMDMILRMPAQEREEFGQKARDFVNSQKVPEVQGRRMVAFIRQDRMEDRDA